MGNEGSSGTKGSGGGLRNPRNDVLLHCITSNSMIFERCTNIIVDTYFQHEQRHRMVLWDSCHTAACHYTLWIYRSVNKEDIVQVNECRTYGVDYFNSQLNQTNLWVKLLFCPSVAILASLSPLTFTGIPPLLTLFHSWTRQRSVAAKKHKCNSSFSTTIIKLLNKIHGYCFLLHAAMEHLYLCLCGLRLLSLLLW